MTDKVVIGALVLAWLVGVGWLCFQCFQYGAEAQRDASCSHRSCVHGAPYLVQDHCVCLDGAQ